MLKNRYFTKGVAICAALVMGMALLTGCGGEADDQAAKSKPETEANETETKATTEDNAESQDNSESGEAFEDISFVDAFYANDGNGTDFMIAFYESKDGDIAYIHDGEEEAFAPYTVENATAEDGTEYLLVQVGETALGYYEDGEDIFMIDDDGTVYAAARLTEEEAEELHSIVTE